METGGFPSVLAESVPELAQLAARITEQHELKKAETSEGYELDTAGLKLARERDAADAAAAITAGKVPPKSGRNEAEALARREALRRSVDARTVAIDRLETEWAQTVEANKDRIEAGADAEQDLATAEAEQALAALRDGLRRLHGASAAKAWIKAFDASELDSMRGRLKHRWLEPTHEHLSVEMRRGFSAITTTLKVAPLLDDVAYVVDMLAGRIDLHAPTPQQISRREKRERGKAQLAEAQEQRRRDARERARRHAG